ncbi:unnamed protein product [Linum trigynum]|uniref:CCHC-type domain-containing protein n=1 Tax=Linum trigynum TaxID=586398 RepID=A0AAV2FDX4_9ROSI
MKSTANSGLATPAPALLPSDRPPDSLDSSAPANCARVTESVAPNIGVSDMAIDASVLSVQASPVDATQKQGLQDLAVPGRRLDPSSQTSSQQTQTTTNPPVLNFKAALAGSAANQGRKSQWTFIGDRDLEPSSFQGEPALKVSTALKERLCQPWQKTLIVRLLGRSITYSYLVSQLKWKWRPVGSLEIIDLNNDTFLATFGNNQDYLRALTGGPWVILDHYLIVHQWSPAFRTSDKPHRSVVAWVQLPELPVHFYHREILFALGNLIGRTIKLDYHTEHLERGKFARIAIELDMTKPLPTRIWLDDFWQAILYENLPTICYGCGRIGHQEEGCPQKRQENQVTTLCLPEPPSQTLSPTNSQEPPAGFGPWMQVTRKSRKQGRKAPNMENPNRGQLQSNRGDLAKISAATKGKNEEISGKGYREGKGKLEQRPGNKKDNSETLKTKLLPTEDKSNGKKKIQPSQEWRPIVEKQQKETQPKSQDKPNPMNVVTDPSSSNSKPQTITQHSRDGKGANIHIITVPELALTAKENQPKESRESVSIRKHFRRKSTEVSSPANTKKGNSLRVSKSSHCMNSSARDGKRPHHKKKSHSHTKSVEELLDHLQATPIPGEGDAGYKGVDEQMSEISNPQQSEAKEGSILAVAMQETAMAPAAAASI